LLKFIPGLTQQLLIQLEAVHQATIMHQAPIMVQLEAVHQANKLLCPMRPGVWYISLKKITT